MTEREPIPDPRTPEQALLAMVARRQDETNDLLRQLLDRLPPTAPERTDGTVELTEPKRPNPATGRGGGKRAPAGNGAPRPARRTSKE